MEYIYIGKIVNSHGIKGELRIISDFKYKDAVFKKSLKLYIGNDKQEMVIYSYRKHKIYDMILFEGINDINQILKYKNELVYAKKEDIKIDGYFNEDLIGMNVYSNEKYIGKVTDIMISKAHDILVIKNNNSKHLIPNIEQFILNIDLENNKIDINEIEGLINEN